MQLLQRASRRTALTSRAVSAVVLAVALGSLAACGEDEPDVAENEISVEEYPDYYPEEYADIVAASKEEGGELVIYSNTSEENWAPIFRDFKKKFPWVEDVSANDLDSDEVFQRVLSEQSTGESPADLIVSNAAVAWADFAEREGTLMEYESPELGELPDFAQLLPNVYAMSTDPMTIAYNTELVTEAPTSIENLADLAEADPDTYQDKITVRDPESSFGFTVTHAFTENSANGWATWSGYFRSRGPKPRPAPRWRRSSPASTWPDSSSAVARRSRSSTTVTGL